GPQQQNMAACPPEVVLADDRVHAQPGGDRVFGIAGETAVLPAGNTGYLAGQLGVRVNLVEQVARGVEKVDLVRGHQRAQAIRVILDLRHRAPVRLRVVVDGVV